MGKFSDVSGISRFTLSTLSGSSGKVYANGRQCVAVYVTLELMDQQYNAVSLSGDELIKLQDSIVLCDYLTGKPLIDIDKVGNVFSDWGYSTESTEWEQFPVTTPYNSVYATNTRIVIPFYIYCPKRKVSPVVNVAASIKINQGEFDTRGGDGFDSYVTIHSVTPVDYRFSTGSLKLIEETVFDRTSDARNENEFGKIYKVIAVHNNKQVEVKNIQKKIDTLFGCLKHYWDESIGYHSPLTDPKFAATAISICLKDNAHSDRFLDSWFIPNIGRVRNLFYDFSGIPVSGNLKLGMGGYYNHFLINSGEGKFVFAVTRRQIWLEDIKHFHGVVHTSTYKFADEYGNEGFFEVSVVNHYNNDDEDYICSDFRFRDV